MKKLLIATSLFIISSLAVQAQKQTKKERIQYLFTLMGQDSMMSKMAVSMSSYMSNSMKTIDDEMGTSTYDSTKSLNTMTSAMESMRNVMKEAMVESYDKHFTATEIEDFITFYASKSGQKMVKELPAISSDMLMTMASKNQSMIKKVMDGQQ